MNTHGQLRRCPSVPHRVATPPVGGLAMAGQHEWPSWRCGTLADFLTLEVGYNVAGHLCSVEAAKLMWLRLHLRPYWSCQLKGRKAAVAHLTTGSRLVITNMLHGRARREVRACTRAPGAHTVRGPASGPAWHPAAALRAALGFAENGVIEAAKHLETLSESRMQLPGPPPVLWDQFGGGGAARLC